MSKCDAKYKNLNEIQSFSEQRYATVQLMEQVCMNDEYLKQQVTKLEYLSPPAIRKRFNPVLLDDGNSFGCVLNQDGEVTFSDEREKEIPVNFNDLDLFDLDKSDCEFEAYLDGDVSKFRACVPLNETSVTVNTSCKNWEGSTPMEAFWYVGYDRAKPYQVKPEWLKNWKDTTIPSVCRAQTFTIPDGISNGRLESVNLRVNGSGSEWSYWGSPLYVQIWRVKKRKTYKAEWVPSQKKIRTVTPRVVEEIYFPDGNPYSALATAEYHPKHIESGYITLEFNKSIEVNAGEHYAIVMLSPLSNPKHSPTIGGFRRSLHRGKYAHGDAFYSEDNGRNWKRYGNTFGRNDPVDFAFQCNIKEYSSLTRRTGEEFYLYLKPIFANQIKKVTVNATGSDGSPSSSTKKLIFEVSSDGINWSEIGQDYSVSFGQDSEGYYPNVAFVRARMEAIPGSGSTTTDTPSVSNMVIELDMEPAKEMYARTEVYNPRTEPMQGATLWGRIYAPFVVEPTVDGSVEVILDSEKSESFEIITAEELPNYTYTEDGVVKCRIPGVDAEKITAVDVDERYGYLIDHPEVIKLFKDNNIYVKPYSRVENNETVTYMLSFEEGVQLTRSPGYPIISCSVTPFGDVPDKSNIDYAEWVDYRFDYDGDIINFHDSVITDMPVGSLKITYNPVFIQDLSETEIGKRSDGDEGLILDYFKETFIIGNSEVASRSIKLRVPAVDPIREVLLNEVELIEDVDFSVDYVNQTLIFPVNNEDGASSILKFGDVLSVVYTPELVDVGLSVGYRAKRGSLDKTIHISGNYFEYKV